MIADEKLPKIEYCANSSLEVVFKVQESCNINCTYCYMYNQGNNAHAIVPSQQASYGTWIDVANFIAHEFITRNPSNVRLVLHGGEPMLVKAEIMEKNLTGFWETLRSQLNEDHLESIQISMQTNAMLVTDKWLELINRWRIGVGVSIDGPKSVNDKFRKDKRGKGTFDRVLEGYETLLQSSGSFLGALCVIDPDSDGAEIYRFLADDLKLRGFNFLLPFMNWDNQDPESIMKTGKFLTAALKEWQRDLSNGKYVNVRVFNEAIKSIAYPQNHEKNIVSVGHNIVVIECDGSIMTEESLRPSYAGIFSDLNVRSITLKDILNSPQFQEVDRDTYALSSECEDCALLYSCRSGQSLGRVGMRYSSASDRVRKSVYCEAFIQLFVDVAAMLDSNSVSIPALSLDPSQQLETLG